MSLDPYTEGFLKMLTSKGAPAFSDLPPEQSRQSFSALCQITAPQEQPDVAIEDRVISLSDRDIPVRIYTPEGQGPFPVLVYYHGGGFVVGSVQDYDPVCRELCHQSGYVVVSVEYRLAPEAAFPAAPNDGYAALCWVAENAASFNGNVDCLIVGGDSAGGNLSAVMAQRSLRESGPTLAGQLLIYPVTNASVETESMTVNAEGYLLTRGDMDYFMSNYVGEDVDVLQPDLSPGATADLSALPPAWVATCEFDPLRDDGENYAAAMTAQGVSVQSKRYDGTIHGAWNLFAVIPTGKIMIADAVKWLKSVQA
ncbi:alpha/beta hydrolase [Spongiibacter sp. KMU-158]|uniref:Alpha/beta hydrolase n=1 Tax=Spongiibacter pelagi TaxID=2760804 RepID=A0A927C0A9_9GAMM|nr:alpha/beta hydrolase [Spongiibacter pelagi]MBD2858898.1 alpha/beta hydrolase [Spongiibacter pelagi]